MIVAINLSICEGYEQNCESKSVYWFIMLDGTKEDSVISVINDDYSIISLEAAPYGSSMLIRSCIPS